MHRIRQPGMKIPFPVWKKLVLLKIKMLSTQAPSPHQIPHFCAVLTPCSAWLPVVATPTAKATADRNILAVPKTPRESTPQPAVQWPQQRQREVLATHKYTLESQVPQRVHHLPERRVMLNRCWKWAGATVLSSYSLVYLPDLRWSCNWKCYTAGDALVTSHMKGLDLI